MGFYSCWQPLADEDRHTALVFGFLRHAPVRLALGPWLSGVLGRSVAPEPLAPESFWPELPSIVDGQTVTIPELVFEATDERGPITVVIEVKPGSGVHTFEQISREVIDTANHHRSRRIAVVMVGADLAAPTETTAWLTRIQAEILTRSLAVEAEIAYSSFALLGEVIATAADRDPAWQSYADDVAAQLRRNGLLGYRGAPMLDDLVANGLTLKSGVEAFNRIIASARLFFLQLHQESDFIASGIQPGLGGTAATSPRMVRDGGSDWIGQPEASFKTSVILSLYSHPDLGSQSRIFIGFDLIARDSSEIQVLAGRMDYTAGQPYDTRRLAAALSSTRIESTTEVALPYVGETTSSS